MLGWLFNKSIKREVKDHLSSLHKNLANSFSTIKGDITNIHTHLQNKDKKLLELEEKIQLLENRLIYSLQTKNKLKQIPELESESYEESEEHRKKIIDLNLASLSRLFF